MSCAMRHGCRDPGCFLLVSVYGFRTPLIRAPRSLIQHQGQGLPSGSDGQDFQCPGVVSHLCPAHVLGPHRGPYQKLLLRRPFHSLHWRLSSLSLGRKLACQVTPHISAKCFAKAGWTRVCMVMTFCQNLLPGHLLQHKPRWALGKSRALDQRGQDEWAMSRTPCFCSLHCAHETVISVSGLHVDILHKWGV